MTVTQCKFYNPDEGSSAEMELYFRVHTLFQQKCSGDSSTFPGLFSGLLNCSTFSRLQIMHKLKLWINDVLFAFCENFLHPSYIFCDHFFLAKITSFSLEFPDFQDQPKRSLVFQNFQSWKIITKFQNFPGSLHWKWSFQAAMQGLWLSYFEFIN